MPKAEGLLTEMRSRTLFSLCLLLAMVLLIVPFTSQYASFFREHKSLRFYANPTYFTYSTIRLVSSKLKGSVAPTVVQAVAQDALLNDGPAQDPKELIILVVGETARVKLPSRPWSPFRNILVRLLIAVGALVLASVVVYFEGDCYADRGDIGGITWIDAIYYATVSLSTTGYGAVAPMPRRADVLKVLSRA